MIRSDPPLCTANREGITISLHIQPRASRTEVCGVQGNALKIRLTSPPVDGAANKLCQEFIATIFGVPKSNVQIISGETSRNKRVLVRSGDIDRLTGILEKLLSLKN